MASIGPEEEEEEEKEVVCPGARRNTASVDAQSQENRYRVEEKQLLSTTVPHHTTPQYSTATKREFDLFQKKMCESRRLQFLWLLHFRLRSTLLQRKGPYFIRRRMEPREKVKVHCTQRPPPNTSHLTRHPLDSGIRSQPPFRIQSVEF